MIIYLLFCVLEQQYCEPAHYTNKTPLMDNVIAFWIMYYWINVMFSFYSLCGSEELFWGHCNEIICIQMTVFALLQRWMET